MPTDPSDINEILKRRNDETPSPGKALLDYTRHRAGGLASLASFALHYRQHPDACWVLQITFPFHMDAQRADNYWADVLLERTRHVLAGERMPAVEFNWRDINGNERTYGCGPTIADSRMLREAVKIEVASHPQTTRPQTETGNQQAPAPQTPPFIDTTQQAVPFSWSTHGWKTEAVPMPGSDGRRLKLHPEAEIESLKERVAKLERAHAARQGKEGQEILARLAERRRKAEAEFDALVNGVGGFLPTEERVVTKAADRAWVGALCRFLVLTLAWYLLAVFLLFSGWMIYESY